MMALIALNDVLAYKVEVFGDADVWLMMATGC